MKTTPVILGIDYGGRNSSTANVTINATAKGLTSQWISRHMIANAVSSVVFDPRPPATSCICYRCEGSFPNSERLRSHFEDSPECLQHFVHNI